MPCKVDTCPKVERMLIPVVTCRSIGPSERVGSEYFGVSRTSYLLSNTTFLFAIAIAPMALNPLSEVLGRVKTFGVAIAVYTILFIPASLTKSYAAFMVTRTFQGVSGSVANSMIAGTFTDMFESKTRGKAINMFTLSIFIGQGVGPAFVTVVCETIDYQWLWGVSLRPRFVCVLWGAYLESRSKESLRPWACCGTYALQEKPE
jgi:MFS family permease